ncbi:MAG: hypothetical protein CTR54_23195 [Rhizobium sp.]|nr:MAG: hypothetical protein CTR54_23195 [Rhizobium sp.]
MRSRESVGDPAQGGQPQQQARQRMETVHPPLTPQMPGRHGPRARAVRVRPSHRIARLGWGLGVAIRQVAKGVSRGSAAVNLA